MQQATASSREGKRAKREREPCAQYEPLELRKLAIGMLAQHPVWNLKHNNSNDTCFQDMYLHFAFATVVRDVVPEAERTITWVPRKGEPFLFHMAFSPSMPVQENAEVTTLQVDASDPLHMPMAMVRAPCSIPRRCAHAFVYFLNAMRRPMAADPATHFKAGAPFAQGTFLCYFIEEPMQNAPSKHKVLVTDMIAKDGHVLMGWMPAERHKLLTECAAHLPMGFVLHDTHSLSRYTELATHASAFVRRIVCGVSGVLELTRNPLLPVVTLSSTQQEL